MKSIRMPPLRLRCVRARTRRVLLSADLLGELFPAMHRVRQGGKEAQDGLDGVSTQRIVVLAVHSCHGARPAGFKFVRHLRCREFGQLSRRNRLPLCVRVQDTGSRTETESERNACVNALRSLVKDAYCKCEMIDSGTSSAVLVR